LFVIQEYVACQQGRHGVLILSEFAGASQSLAGVISINPWDCEGTAGAIQQALTMQEEEKKSRHDTNFTHVMSHTAQVWARSFVNTLEQCDNSQNKEIQSQEIEPSAPVPIEELMEAFRSGQRRLIITGLSGLVALVKQRIERRKSIDSGVNSEPKEPGLSSVEESEMSLNASISFDDLSMRGALNSQLTGQEAADLLSDPSVSNFLNDIRALSDDPNTIYVLLTSRSRQWCDRILSNSGCWAVAENGFFFKTMRGEIPVITPQDSLVEDGTGWYSLFGEFDFSWKPAVQRVIEYFTDRTPHSFIEQQESMVGWNFALAEPEFANRQVLDLVAHLRGGMLANTATEIVEENGRIEVRPTGIHRARALKTILHRLENRHRFFRAEGEQKNDKIDYQPEFDFLLCLGSFAGRDDEIFSLLNEWPNHKAKTLPTSTQSSSHSQSQSASEPVTASHSPSSPSSRIKCSILPEDFSTMNLFSPANFGSQRLSQRHGSIDALSSINQTDSLQATLSAFFYNPAATPGSAEGVPSFSFSPAASPHYQFGLNLSRRFSTMSALQSSLPASLHHSMDFPHLITEDSTAPSTVGTPLASSASHSRSSTSQQFEGLEAEIDRLRLANRPEKSEVQVFTINVGSAVRSNARWNVQLPRMANEIIHKLANIVRENSQQESIEEQMEEQQTKQVEKENAKQLIENSDDFNQSAELNRTKHQQV
jgi:trehalose-6-phosphatase